MDMMVMDMVNMDMVDMYMVDMGQLDIMFRSILRVHRSSHSVNI